MCVRVCCSCDVRLQIFSFFANIAVIRCHTTRSKITKESLFIFPLIMSEFSKAKKHHQLDDLVQYVTLHVIIPFPLGGNLLPFIILYILWLYWNIGIFIEGLDSDQYSDSAFFSLLGIAFLQLFVALCCFWNVHIKTFLHCRKVSK